MLAQSSHFLYQGWIFLDYNVSFIFPPPTACNRKTACVTVIAYNYILYTPIFINVISKKFKFADLRNY